MILLTKKEKILKKELISFEKDIKKIYEKGKIKGPIHLSGNNEESLIKIFRNIKKNDWVISTWRSHYHALLHGFSKTLLKKRIIQGRSMGINSKKFKFYSSSIVGGGLPIGIGIAMANKMKNINSNVWIFVGDMTYETGVFHECYKYAKNFKLQVKFVVEDNNLSTNTPTDKTWNIKSQIKKDIIYYKYKRKYPHHGTGNWVLF
jgi:TPP-dependent pyruvate/acetoin dehydrogenase alpha subunit